jgi:hypothetical protein
MNKFRGRILASAAAVAVGALFLSAPTFAATVVPISTALGNLDPANAGDYDATVTGTGAFTVEATFELTKLADTTISTTIAVNRSSNYTPGDLELFKNGTLPGDLIASAPLTFSFSGAPPAGAWAVSGSGDLGPGTYFVEVTGTSNVGTLGVGGSVITSNVPEPSTWAMMTLGFIGLGYVAFRQRKSKVSIIAA